MHTAVNWPDGFCSQYLAILPPALISISVRIWEFFTDEADRHTVQPQLAVTSLFEELQGLRLAQLLKKFTAFSRRRKFIVQLRRVSHCSHILTKRIQSVPSPIYFFTTILMFIFSSTTWSPKWFLSFGFLDTNSPTFPLISADINSFWANKSSLTAYKILHRTVGKNTR